MGPYLERPDQDSVQSLHGYLEREEDGDTDSDRESSICNKMASVTAVPVASS